MSILSGKAIWAEMKEREGLIITPLLDKAQVGDSSVDVRLGHEFIVLRRPSVSHIDPTDLRSGHSKSDINKWQERVRVSLFQPVVLSPGQLVLGATLEYISLPKTIAATVEGRSSWARLGLVIATATSIGPGFKGCVTLELVNLGGAPLVVYPGFRIAQIIFQRIEGSGDYKGKYDCPTGPQFGKVHDEADLTSWGPRKI